MRKRRKVAETIALSDDSETDREEEEAEAARREETPLRSDNTTAQSGTSGRGGERPSPNGTG